MINRYPKDSNNQLCGYKSGGVDYTTKPFLYFFNPLDSGSAQVCVESCPVASASGAVDPASISNVVCKSSVVKPVTTSELSSAIQIGDCSPIIYDSKSVLKRCVPTSIQGDMITALTNAGASVKDANVSEGQKEGYANLVARGQDVFVSIVNDLAKTWYWILAGMGVALVITLIWVFFLRYLTGFFVWTCVFASLVLMYGFSVWMWFFWQQTKTASVIAQSEEQRQWEEKSAMGVFIAACSISVRIPLLD